jgi:hypothetical protein
MANNRPRISTQLKGFIGDPPNYSGRINTIISRYQTIIQASVPVLTENEWLTIMLAGNEEMMFITPDPATKNNPAHYVCWAVADYGQSNPDVDCQKLTRKLKKMSFVEQCALMEVIYKFWETTDILDPQKRLKVAMAGVACDQRK